MIVSSDKKGTFDIPTYNILEKIKTDVPIVLMCRWEDYEFNPELYKLDKWVLADFSELGANQWDLKETFLWGKNTSFYKPSQTDEWGKFNEFVKENPPVVYFKRELLKKDFKDNVYPIDFPCLLPEYPIQTEKEFNKRSIDVVNWWGYSHELRRMLHGGIFINAVKRNRAVIDNLTWLADGLNDNRKIWATVFTPHYARYDKEQIMKVNGMSKLSVSLPGAGIKCFRHTEASANSIMVMRDDPVAWTYGWGHGINCIKFQRGGDENSIRGLNGASEIIESIEEALQRKDLYDIYRNGVETCKKYMIKNYVENYLEPIINDI